MTRTHAMLLCAGISLGAMSLSAAQARDAPTPIRNAAADSGITDIVVTGEKRETTLQSAPLAITALPGDQLLQRNLNQVNDLNGYVPGLTIAKSEGAERIISIRGIGYETAQNPNSQPGVAFHIDGVYVANVLALNQDLLDVDRVEVLRGPQGTVFGITSTGGAINVITKKPVLGQASGTASLSAGNYGYVKALGTVNLPISDTIAMRASAQFLQHNPYGYSVAVPGRSKYGLDDAFDIGLRASVLWKPNDTFTALLEGQHFHQDRNASLQKDISDPEPDPRRVTSDFPGTFRINTDMLYLTLTQELPFDAALKSVTAYQYLNKHQTSDSDRLADPASFDHVVFWQDRSKTFSQEVSLSSTGKQSIDYTVGAVYLRQRALQNILELTVPERAGLPGTNVKFQTDSPYQHTAIGVYGNATAHLTDRLSLIAGARYNYDKITAQPFQYFRVITPKKATSEAITGKIGLDYQVTPANLVYVTGSRGYKPTGLSFVSDAPFVPGSFTGGPEFVRGSFKKETVTAIEIGAKNRFFDDRLTLNLAGYYNWYKNLQYTAEDPVPFAGGTANIPKAEIWGAEAEFSALPFAGMRIDGNVAYGRGKFTSSYLTIDAQTAARVRAATYAAIGFPADFYYNPAVEAAVAAARTDLDGRSIPKLPRWQGQLSPSYAWRMFGGKVTLRGDLIHRGGFNYRVFAVAALDRVAAYTIYNAFVSYEPEERPWSLSFSALNLTDKNGINSRFSDPYGAGTTSVEYIDPRQVFATVNFKF